MTDQDESVSQIMQTEMVTLRESDRLDLADDVMQQRHVRHMPVLSGTKLVGVVSARDLLAASLSKSLEFDPQERRTFLHSVHVAEVMTPDVITVVPESSLKEAAELMVKNRVGCLPVVGPEQVLVGLVTETDLLKATLL